MPQPFRIKTDNFSASELLLESFSCSEGFSTLTEISASLLSPRSDLEADKILGRPVTFELELRGDARRHLHGFVTRFALTGATGRFHRYQAVVRPWLWFLTRTTDCRIFQDLTVPDIVKTVFEDHPIAVHDFKLFRDYRPWDYCVQYRESDFAFVSRLLEHEGIYYRFEHSDGEHKLILLDSASAHDPQPEGADALPFFSAGQQPPPDLDFVSRWAMTRAVQPGKFAIKDYDFQLPASKLLVDAEQPREHDLADAEWFDYPGGFTKSPHGQHYLENRRDEAHSRFEVFSGATNAQSLRTGFTFTLARHPRADQNTEYLVTGTELQASNGSFEAGAGGSAGFHCEFRALLATQQFRPPRRTPDAVMPGPQTAVVVGKDGEEIHTDKFGRVRVQFHWDRLGQRNEKSSCMVRVAQVWAGKNFGAMFIPRVGHEVVVDFLEGDPNQPIITGSVYNGDNLPPWALPANATQSGVLTRSSKGGGVANANAIRFEDKQGAEQLWIHAEKNQDIEVEADETHWVGHDRSKTVDHDETTHVKHDRTETVDNNETITIGVDRSESVGSNETISIGANRTETVGANETISIGGDRSITVSGSETATVALQRTHAVGVNETITIGAAQEVAIGAMQAIVVGANRSVSVGANLSTNVGANHSVAVAAKQSVNIGSDHGLTVGGAQSVGVGKARTTVVAENDTLNVGKNLVITAADSVSIKTGDASIVMKKDGTITIKGKDITLDGSGKIKVKAGSTLVMNGSKITQN
jgi:type VI secretion system secreted protein VgrG